MEESPRRAGSAASGPSLGISISPHTWTGGLSPTAGAIPSWMPWRCGEQKAPSLLPADPSVTQNICVKQGPGSTTPPAPAAGEPLRPTDVATSSANFGTELPLGCLAFVGCKNNASEHYADPLFPILPNLRLLCESTAFCHLCKQVCRNIRLQPLGSLQGKFKAMKKYELFFHEPIKKGKLKNTLKNLTLLFSPVLPAVQVFFPQSKESTHFQITPAYGIEYQKTIAFHSAAVLGHLGKRQAV